MTLFYDQADLRSALLRLETQFFDAIASPLDETRRLFHGRGRCFPNLEHITIDWLDGVILVSLFRAPEPEEDAELLALLLSWTSKSSWKSQPIRAFWLQYRQGAESSMRLLWGDETPSLVIREGGLRYQLTLDRNQNPGLFLDMKNGRQWVHDNAKNANVLNLFAYTCGFSVAAVAGEANQVVNLDMAKGPLSRGRDNHRLNQLPLDNVSFFAHDIFKSWGKLKKYGPYDLIVIDPPTFQKGSFALSKDYGKILRRLPSLLANNGKVLACVNDPSLSSEFLLSQMAEFAPECQFQQRLANPETFPDRDPEGGLKALIFDYHPA
jgi:23S rRNA (cytosine1962-C5)-methyltransferase